eukprot:710798-Rhodomonas_salina.1
MGEAHGLVCVVDLDSVSLEPRHPQNGSHAFQGKDPEDDVALVLAVDLRGRCDLVGDLEERAVRKTDGAVVGQLDE